MNHGADPDYLTLNERRVIEALAHTSDPREAARIAFPNHRPRERDRKMDRELWRLEQRRWVSQINGQWTVAPHHPHRRSLSDTRR